MFTYFASRCLKEVYFVCYLHLLFEHIDTFLCPYEFSFVGSLRDLPCCVSDSALCPHPINFMNESLSELFKSCLVFYIPTPAFCFDGSCYI
ncbi:hypothetical protein EVA_14970 [gut metagenome]|uniref:Uncharacterized protein n=1 Tax=gut metagenome TaxID=749906 RepID=J9GBZ2_9ZZZZ